MVRWWDARPLALCGHALVETYAVLTRLPGDLRLQADDARPLLRERFEHPVVLPEAVAAAAVERLAGLGVTGGATYDALVALAAKEAGQPLATRDARARATYQAVGVEVVVVG